MKKFIFYKILRKRSLKMEMESQFEEIKSFLASKISKDGEIFLEFKEHFKKVFQEEYPEIDMNTCQIYHTVTPKDEDISFKKYGVCFAWSKKRVIYDFCWTMEFDRPQFKLYEVLCYSGDFEGIEKTYVAEYSKLDDRLLLSKNLKDLKEGQG